MQEEAWMRIQTIMTDGDPSYPHLVSTLLPQAQHQLCWWHQARNMEPKCSYASDPGACWKLMESAISAFDEIEAESKWLEMMQRFWSESALSDRITDQSRKADAERKKAIEGLPNWAQVLPGAYRNALKCIQRWYDDRKKYWRSYTQSYFSMGSVSTQGAESMNHALKHRSFVHLKELMEMVLDLSKEQLLLQLDSNWRTRSRAPLGQNHMMHEWLLVLRTQLTQFAIVELTEQFTLSVEKTYRMAEVHDGVFSVRNTAGKDFTVNFCRLNISRLSCSCGYVTSRLLCRHCFVVCQFKQGDNDLARIAITSANTRWLETQLDRAVHASQLIPATNERLQAPSSEVPERERSDSPADNSPMTWSGSASSQATGHITKHHNVIVDERLWIPDSHAMMKVALGDMYQRCPSSALEVHWMLSAFWHSAIKC